LIYKEQLEERMEEQETETDTISLEDTLQSLKRNAYAVEIHLQQSIQNVKKLQKHVLEESKDISQHALQPRTRMMKWLTDRGLPVESSFQEFFEVFLDEHKKDHRLDLSRRTISLNTEACILFGYKSKHVELHILDLMEKLPILYE
jgi:hypothetical protein